MKKRATAKIGSDAVKGEFFFWKPRPKKSRSTWKPPLRKKRRFSHIQSKAQTPWLVRDENERIKLEMEQAIAEIVVPDGWTKTGDALGGIVVARTKGDKRISRVIDPDGNVMSETAFTVSPPTTQTYTQTLTRLLKEGDKHFLRWAVTNPEARELAIKLGVKLPIRKKTRKEQ
jgi:hypothetical protein